MKSIATIVGGTAITLAAAALGLTVVTTATHTFAQPLDAATSQSRTAKQDTEFLKKANQGSVDEVALAQLAVSKATDDEVKTFAQKMIDDHTKLLDDMKPFDMEAGTAPPEHPSLAAEATKVKLDLLSGKAFDKAYVKEMVEDHHKDCLEFQKEEKATDYPAFKAAVGKGLEVVKGHLEMIDQIAKKDGIAPAPAGGK